MKVVKRIIVGVLIAALASAGIYTGLMHVKESKVTEVPVTSVSNLMTDWYSETTLDGTITTNVAQEMYCTNDGHKEYEAQRYSDFRFEQSCRLLKRDVPYRHVQV